MKVYFFKKLSRPLAIVIFLASIISLEGDSLNAEYLSEEFQIDSSTKTEKEQSAIPTNPFEIVEMIRRSNSLNDATSPSDALDEL